MPPIIKADGSVEPFAPARLVASLRRSGAGEHTAEGIAEQITATLVAGTPSKEIYARAFALLRKEGRPVAARYGLRRALLELGPTGHPFEDFVSRLLAAEGWEVKTRQMIRGKCVTHEVDIYAKKGGENLAAELKYHNDPGYKTDLKTALYVRARFEDIWQCDPKAQVCAVDRGFLVTNTKFTSEAVAFAACAGVELLGWSEPRGDALLERMCRVHVYPVTTLTTLSKSEKRLLIERGIVAAGDLRQHREVLVDLLRLEPARVGEILAEEDALKSLPHPSDMV